MGAQAKRGHVIHELTGEDPRTRVDWVGSSTWTVPGGFTNKHTTPASVTLTIEAAPGTHIRALLTPARARQLAMSLVFSADEAEAAEHVDETAPEQPDPPEVR